MKQYRYLDLIGKTDERFIKEVLDIHDSERRSITMSKKRIVAVAVAAALVLALGVSAVAAYLRGLNTVEKYISDREESIRLPESFATVAAQDIGTEIEPEDDEAFNPGDARATGVIVSRDSFYATVEINASDAGLDDYDYPDYFDGKFQSGKFGMTADVDGEEVLFGYTGNTPMVSCEDGIMTLVMHFSAYLPEGVDAINVEIGEFGYTSYDNPPDKEHVAVSDKVYSFSIPVDESDMVVPVNSVNEAECDGVKFTAAVDSLGLHFYPQLEISEENNETVREIFDTNKIGIKMKDGTEMKGLFYDTSVPHVLAGGFMGAGETYFSFETLVDVEEIESISLGDAVFKFE